MKRGMFKASGTTASAVAVVGPVNGVMVCDSLSYTDDAAGLLKFYAAKFVAKANAAASASTSLAVVTDAAGKVGGALLTTGDVVIVATTTGLAMRTISVVGSVSNGVVTLTLGAAVTCAAGASIYVVKADDISSITTANETKVNLQNMFCSYRGMPVAVELTSGSTGSHFFSGTFHSEE